MAQKVENPQGRYRVRVFVDFWNYELHMKETDQAFLTDWKAFGPALVKAAIDVVNPNATPDYQGLNVYASFDDQSPSDEGFRRWATTVLDTFPGVNVSLVPRQKKASGPKCPSCHHVIEDCPSCGNSMRGKEEKGVDTRMVTDMISLAWADNYDIAVLASTDRDFVPVAEFLQTRGIKVIHAAFPPKGAQLTQKCWASVNLPKMRKAFERKGKGQA